MWRRAMRTSRRLCRRPTRGAFALAVALTATAGCGTEQRTASGLDGWLAGTPDEKFDVVAKHLRGFDMAMVETEYRYQQLYWAGEDENWAYADYQVQKIRTAIENGLERRPKRAASAETFLTMVLPAVGQAIAAHDQALFRQRFGALTAACNSCHDAEQMAFVRVVVPTMRTGPAQ
jgi:hypothetical protein